MSDKNEEYGNGDRYRESIWIGNLPTELVLSIILLLMSIVLFIYTIYAINFGTAYDAPVEFVEFTFIFIILSVIATLMQVVAFFVYGAGFIHLVIVQCVDIIIRNRP